MPFTDWTKEAQAPELNFGTDPFFAPEPESPSVGRVAQAAFQQENDIVNGLAWATRERYDPDPNFDVYSHVRDNYPDLIQTGEASLFAGAKSLLQFNQLMERKDREQRQRDVIDAAGWSGTAWAVAAGIISPTTFIPLIGVGAKGAKAAAQGALYVGGAIAAQEAVLRANQLLRTNMESGLAIGSGVVLGGILGGAVGQFGKKEGYRALSQKFADDLDDLTPDTLVNVQSPRFDGVSTVGAAVAKQAPDGTVGLLGGKIKFGKGAASLEQLGPVTRSLNNPLRSARWAMAQISDAGLKLAGKEGQVFAPGGTIENRQAKWRGNLMEGLRGLDDAYARYIYNDAPPKFAASTRASMRGVLSSNKMSQREFYHEVTRAMRAGEEGRQLREFSPEVLDAVSKLNEHVYGPLLERQQRAGLLPEEVKTVGDLGYINRIYNIDYIKAHENEFVDILARHYERLTRERFVKQAEKATAREDAATQALEDLKLNDTDRAALVEKLQQQLAEENPAQRVLNEIQDLKDAAAVDEVNAKELLERAAELRKQNADAIKKYQRRRNPTRSRLKRLDSTIAQLEKTRARKMGQIEGLEEKQLNDLDRFVGKVDRLRAKADKLDDAKLATEIAALEARFQKTAASLTRSQERLNKAWASVDDKQLAVLHNKAVSVETNVTKMERYGERLADKQALVEDRNGLMEELNGLAEEAREATRKLIENKTLRKQKILKEVDLLDPERAVAQAEEQIAAAREAAANLTESYRVRGVDDIDLREATGNFREASLQIARDTVEKIKGQNGLRIVGVDILRGERGPELQRVLSIPSSEIEPFLENNVEKLVRAYVRTVAPDVELAERFGSVNAASVFDEIRDEAEILIEASQSVTRKEELITETTAELRAARKGGDEAEVQKLQDRLEGLKANLSAGEINAARDAATRDLAAVVGRLRHTWGIPADPSGFAARGVRIAQNINTLRFMGMVAVSSIPDIARGIQKYGPGRFFRDGLGSLVGGMKGLKLSLKEAQLAGTALDIFLHTRMYEMMEMVDDFGKRSKFEEGLEFATSKIGVLGMFDYWNTYMKGFASVLFNAEMTDALRTVATKQRGSKSVDDAIKFLAGLNIDGASAGDMWRILQAGGGEEVRPGFWLPQTDDWGKAAEGLGKRKTPALPPVRPGKIRMYHSGDNATSGGSRWFSTDKTYAENYRANVDTWYVDVPDTLEQFTNAVEGQGPKDGFTFNIDLAEDLVKQAKKYDRTAIDTEIPVMPASRVDELKRLYQQALVREVDSIVVTPGLERPLMMDSSLAGKLLFQFRSFAVSSTFKTLMAGLQERNANFVLGSGAALAMGALSYKLWGIASGNDTSKEGYDKWADEALDRSGLLGVFAEVRNVGSTIPWLNDYVMFSGEQTVRRGGTGMTMAVAGPSLDALATLSAVISGLDDPTEGTARQARKLLPYQNLWWARQAIWDNLIEGLDLPEDRK